MFEFEIAQNKYKEDKKCSERRRSIMIMIDLGLDFYRASKEVQVNVKY